MPEGDRFERSLGAGWLSAFRLVMDEGTAAEVNDKLVESLAKALRREGGIPGLEEIAAVVEGQQDASPLVVHGALDSIVREHGGHRHTRIAADVAKSSLMLSEFDPGATARGDVAQRIAVRSCIALMDHYFFGRTRERLIAEGRLRDHEGAHGWRGQAIEAIRPRIEKVAHKLLKNPDATGLRTPPRETPKKSTSDLLREELGASLPSATP